MIRILLGRGGSGKSRAILAELAGHAQSQRRALLLVPEQYTLQAERDLIDASGMGGLLTVEVMSPTRLAREVLRRAGQDGRVTVDGLGRAMALRRVAGMCQGELSLYASSLRRPRFCGELADFFGDLKRFDVQAADLRSAAGDLEGSLLARKLADISLLLERFQTMMEGRSFWDQEDRLNAFVDALPGDEELRGVPVYLDGFDYLPPQSVRMICALEQAAGTVTLALTAAQPGDGDAEIFAAGEASLRRVAALADTLGILVETQWLAYDHPEKPAELRHLERKMFCYPSTAFQGTCRALRITQALTMQEEIDVCAGRILALAQAERARYRDIAVLCADLASYAPEVERTFRQWGIPVFLDAKRSVLAHPLSEVLMASLQLLAWGWRGEDLIRLAKTGLLPLAAEEVEAVHIYLKATGRRGRARLAAPWREKLPMLEGVDLPAIQERLLGPLLALDKEVGREASAGRWAAELTGLLQAWKVDGALEALAQEQAGNGRDDLSQENAQLWELLQRLLEQMATLVGEEPLEAQEVMGMLESGLAQAQVGVLPAQSDAVVVGDVGRTKLSQVRYLFILGAREGAFPVRYAEGAIFSDRDMAQLADRRLEVGRDAGLRGAQSRFGAYAASAKPQRGLILSYALSALDGETAQPSRLLTRLTEMFGIPMERPGLWDLPAPELHMGLVAQAIRSLRRGEMPAGPWKGALATLGAVEGYRERVERLMGGISMEEAIPDGIPGAQYSSVSRLEQYARCPFAWFMEYVIKPREWDSLLPDPAGEGSYIHEALYAFSKLLETQPEEPDPAWVDAAMERITDRLQEEAFAGTLGDTALSRHLARRLREICQRTAKGIARQCRRGEFRPVLLEESFGPGSALDAITVELPDGKQASLSGKVDRVDVFSMGEVDYLRIIDYKSGQKDLDLAGAKDGYQMQLWIYLDALCRGWKARTGREGRPAGVFYCPARDAYELAETLPEEEAQPQPLRGALLDEPALCLATDRQWSPGTASRVAEVTWKKDGSLGKGGMSARALSAVRRGVRLTVRELLERSGAGVITPSPIQTGNDPQCAYCGYRASCQNGLARQYTPRRKSTGDQVEAWLEKLMEEEEKDAPLDNETESRH